MNSRIFGFACDPMMPPAAALHLEAFYFEDQRVFGSITVEGHRFCVRALGDVLFVGVLTTFLQSPATNQVVLGWHFDKTCFKLRAPGETSGAKWERTTGPQRLGRHDTKALRLNGGISDLRLGERHLFPTHLESCSAQLSPSLTVLHARFAGLVMAGVESYDIESEYTCMVMHNPVSSICFGACAKSGHCHKAKMPRSGEGRSRRLDEQFASLALCYPCVRAYSAAPLRSLCREVTRAARF